MSEWKASLMELRLKLDVARGAIRKAVLDRNTRGETEAGKQASRLENMIKERVRQIAAVWPSSQTIKMKPLALAGGSERAVASNATRPGDPDSPVGRVIESEGLVRFLCRCGVEVTVRFETGSLGHVTCECGRQYGSQAVVMLTNRGRITRR